MFDEIKRQLGEELSKGIAKIIVWLPMILLMVYLGYKGIGDVPLLLQDTMKKAGIISATQGKVSAIIEVDNALSATKLDEYLKESKTEAHTDKFKLFFDLANMQYDAGRSANDEFILSEALENYREALKFNSESTQSKDRVVELLSLLDTIQ